MYKVLAGIIAIFMTNTALALNGEYKNSLSKIDLNKSSDSSYSINLYTQKEFSEPVKVIKKSDLNYYILLPETKNNAQRFSLNNPDIRSVDTQLFPYAGSDVKNGYTKININTTKPINFTVRTNVLTASSQKAPTVSEIKNEVKTASEDTKVQKKNLVQEAKKQDNNLANDKKTNSPLEKEASKPLKVAAAAKILPKKLNENTDKVSQKTTEKQKAKPIQPVSKPENKINEDKTNIIENQQQALENNAEQEPNPIIQEEIQPQNIVEDEPQKEEQAQESVSEPKNQAFAVKKISFSKTIEKINNKLSEYGLSIKEFLLMLIAGIFSILAMFFILTRNKETDTRLKSKADFIDKTTNKNVSLHPKKEKQEKAQCFVFDKGVHQTGLVAPSTSPKRNYELSSYEPSLHRTSTIVEPYQAKQVKSEYDILQNILKEDAFIELTDEDIQQVKQVTDPIIAPKKEVQEIVKVPEIKETTVSKDEPEILSNVEIAPQRGFMCVSYNNSISLMGYIFDDVFALYNFQQPKLENYNIKFRLSEKTSHGANFIVRVDKIKMLIGVTKSSMNLELAL